MVSTDAPSWQAQGCSACMHHRTRACMHHGGPTLHQAGAGLLMWPHAGAIRHAHACARTLYSKAPQATGSATSARQQWPSVHVSGRPASRSQLPRAGWLPTSTTLSPGCVHLWTLTDTCVRARAHARPVGRGGGSEHAPFIRGKRVVVCQVGHAVVFGRPEHGLAGGPAGCGAPHG